MKTIKDKEFFGVSHYGKIYVPPIYNRNYMYWKDESGYICTLTNEENKKIVLFSDKEGVKLQIDEYSIADHIKSLITVAKPKRT